MIGEKWGLLSEKEKKKYQDLGLIEKEKYIAQKKLFDETGKFEI